MIDGLAGLNLMLSNLEKHEMSEDTAKWIAQQLWSRASSRTRREIEARLDEKGLLGLLRG